jgi:hypothetical protein
MDGGSDDQDMREIIRLEMLMESDSQVGEKHPHYILHATSWDAFLAVHKRPCSTLSRSISRPS